jgi:biopolymer transport protein ExbB/TolQ
MWRSLVAALCLALAPCAVDFTFEARAAHANSPFSAYQEATYPDDWGSQTEDICYWGVVQKTPHVVRFVYLLLFAMGIAIVVVGIKRVAALVRERLYLDALERDCLPALRDGRVLDGLIAAARDERNRFGQSLARAIRTLGLEPSGQLVPLHVELARADLRRECALHSVEVGRGIALLSSIGATASLLGLLATIVGISDAIQGFKMAEGTGIGALAGGMSEAFVLVAFGLFVSLTAVWVRGHLTSRADDLRVRLKSITTAFEVYCLAREDRGVTPFNVFEATGQESSRRQVGVLGAWR